MYLWLGLRIPVDIESKIRKIVTKYNRKYEFDEIAFELPQHISLKIAFECKNYIEIVTAIEENVLSQFHPLVVEKDEIEISPGIIWIRFKEDKVLKKLHQDIIEFLEKEYMIKPHELDLEFIYHTTLIHDENADIDNLQLLCKKLNKKIKFNDIFIDKVIFGISENNKPKTFRIIKEKHL